MNMLMTRLSLISLMLFFFGNGFSQEFFINKPVIFFEDNQLEITYDIISKNKKDVFFVWVELERPNGERVRMKTFQGDAGESIAVGTNHKIIWLPARDSIFLDEDVFIEVKAEKYENTFNRSFMLLYSAALPGLGQSKISNNPWWLSGVAVYSSLIGGVVVNNIYADTYADYQNEFDPGTREELLNQAQNQKNLASALLISGAGLYAANLIWMAVIPNKTKPLKYSPIALSPSISNISGTPLFSLRINF